MSFQFTAGRFRAFDNYGNPLVGGKLHSYASGTTTAKATYTDSTLTTPNTNPILLDARGEADVWLGSGAYTFTLRGPDDVLIETKNGIVSGDAPAAALALTLAAPSGAAGVGFKQNGTGAATRSAQDKMRERVSVQDFGAAADGITDDSGARSTALSNHGAVHYGPGQTRATSWSGAGGAMGLQTLHANTVEADESFPGQGASTFRRHTTTNKDAIYGEHYGTGTGYAVHGISYATTGSGVGGACWGQGAGVVGNKRGSGAGTAGNGVYGAAGIDNGSDQTGVFGQFSGSGSNGSGLAGRNDSTNVAGGSAIFGWRSGSGGGAGGSVRRDGSGDGQGETVIRTGTGNGDAITAECSTTGAGQAVTGTRKASETGATYSIGYLGYYNGTMSVGVYGYAPAGGSVQWGGKFDGNTDTTGFAQIGSGVRPITDGTGDCGTPSKRWANVYAASGVVSTSDERLKQDVRALDDRERAAAIRCKGLLRAYRFRDAVAAKGDKARIHFGVMAQAVAEAFEAEGLDANDYALLCYDEWAEQPEVLGDDGAVVVPYSPAGNRYGVRYDELLAFVVSAL